ncbi:MAG: outer membrane protein assembly factor BamE [Rubrivivax sp.]
MLAGLLLSGALLSGCDPQRVTKLEEGVSTEAQVREQFGDPVTVTVEADGARRLDYPRQPAGWTNYVIRIGPDGKMSSLRQLLNDDNMARVQPGLTMQQVRDLLGRPAAQQHFTLKQQDVWDWRYKPQGQESKLFSVTFDNLGVVVGSSVADDPREVAK